MLTKEARREFPRMKDVGPWRVLKVHEWGKVTVERISKRTGRPWRDLWEDYWLEKVEEKSVAAPWLEEGGIEEL